MHFTARFRKVDGKMVYASQADENKHLQFKSFLAEGQEVEGYFELIDDNQTLGQLSKIHKLIRDIAISSGNSFGDIKMEVKRKSGLCWRVRSGAEKFKSFADCSRDELTLAIQEAELISMDLGIPII